MTKSAISLRNLRKVYKGSKKSPPKEALKSITLDIPQGSIFGLLGPNGAGKSTIINICAGLVKKTGGTVRVWDADLDDDVNKVKKSIGVVPQELSFDPFFTPRQVLELQAGMFGVPTSKRITNELLERVGLVEQADAYARSLSGGMKRRLMIAKAMVHAPPILVLDEPTAGVDVALRQMLWQNVRALNDKGTTIILTTHYLEEAEDMADEIAIINKGEIVAHAPKRELLQHLDVKKIEVTLDRPVGESFPQSWRDFVPEALSDTHIVFTYRPLHEPVDAVLTAIHAAGFKVCDLQSHNRALEDVFLSLTA